MTYKPAARLAKNGHDVTVLQKESTRGGRCNQIIGDGHRFDIRPTLFLMPEVYVMQITPVIGALRFACVSREK